ncbi:hypothetical protein AXX12_02255 [Anaerosporomusa subterranea]|uniref:Uncharacterized protein n=1 Tax=Anaerosporomusa subterranea TaxID=1794912 RepID=A0A154BSP0_ANASB|nr:hypothetical protein [Anaerosporomusa subterranea]KYZ76986.1 hypothetical protein AXX12_02255 [Anaerosporomusa subterranea]
MSNESKRGYTHIQALEKEILEMIASGKTQREVFDYFGFKNKYVIKRFVSRYRRRQFAEEDCFGLWPLNNIWGRISIPPMSSRGTQ